MKVNEFMEENASRSLLPKIKRNESGGKLESPFAMPEDAEVTPLKIRFSEWSKKNGIENDKKRHKGTKWKFGRRASKSKALPSNNLTNWANRKSTKKKIKPKWALSRPPKTPSKTESKSTNPCTSSSAKNDKPYSSKCLSITKDKKSINSKTSHASTAKD